MKFIKVQASICDQQGNRNQQMPPEVFHIATNLIVAIDNNKNRIWTHEKTIKIDGKYYTDIFIKETINLDNL